MPALSNLEEYAHPHLYDLENADFEPEGSFYLELAKELGGPILELGCGTGRITIPLAQNGLEITGLDVVPGMLTLARQKAGDLPIHWVEADARNFDLGKQFNLIFENGAVFMHMLTNADQHAFLACVREHLAEDGRFVFSVMFPHPDDLESTAEEKEWYTYQDAHGSTVRVSGTEEYNHLRQVKLETAIRRISSPDGPEVQYVAPMQLRYTFPQEMERVLEYTGFEVKQRYGGPDRSPLTPQSSDMVFVCAKKKHSPGEPEGM
jgi:SAM-dependent methyltransferase